MQISDVTLVSWAWNHPATPMVTSCHIVYYITAVSSDNAGPDITLGWELRPNRRFRYQHVWTRNYDVIITGLQIPYDSRVTTWTYFATRHESWKALIWRYNPHWNRFQVIGLNDIPGVSLVDRIVSYNVPPDDQIIAKQGRFSHRP